MNKIVLSALLASAVLSASDYNYEVSPMVGYLWNSTQDETNLANGGAMGGVDDHAVFGLEAQINNISNVIKPELSVLYGRDQATGYSSKTGVLTTMVNGVYEMNTISNIIPFAKAGLGYEWYGNTHPSDFDGMLLDAGLGAKMDITKSIALKLEALYMYKMNNNGMEGSNGEVHNVAALAGLTFKFGAKTTPVIAAVVAPVVAAIVAEQKQEPKVEPKVEVKPVAVVPAAAVAAVVAPIDSDKDGVFDPTDKCPTTPTGFKVDADGCPIKATLHLNFATDGHGIDAIGNTKVNNFAAFLKESPAYKANIVGHTDSTASDKYNQKLSEKRAQMVKTMLIDQGVTADRLTASGKGETTPVASNKTKQGRAENRRIEVELTH